MPTEKDVLAALSTVMDPELNVSLVQAGMVKSVRVDAGRVSATIELTTPACPLKGKIQADAEAALKAVPGVTGLDITWGAQVRGQPQGTGMWTLSNICFARTTSARATSCGVVTSTAPEARMLCEMVRATSPVPGGRSITR